MFGYLVAADNALEAAERERYRAVYCGVCRSLARCFGQTARLTLRYDMVFLVLLLNSLYEPEEEAGTLRCVRHPARPQAYVCSAVSDYAAHMNAALACLKCRDDWQDERSLAALAAARGLEPCYRLAAAQYPRQCEAIENAIRSLTELERQGRADPDAAADCCGAMMEEILAWREDRWTPTLRRMGHALGRYLYLVDAAVDLEEDARRGRYNPFLPQAGQDNAQRFRDILRIELGECLAAFDRLPLVRDVGLMQNILCVGAWIRFEDCYSRKDDS